MKKIMFFLIIIGVFSCTTIRVKEQEANTIQANNWAYIIVKNDIISSLPQIIVPKTGIAFYDITITRADLLYQIGENLITSNIDPKIKQNYIEESKYNIFLLDKLDTINDFRGKFTIRKAPEVLELIVVARNKLSDISNKIQNQIDTQN